MGKLEMGDGAHGWGEGVGLEAPEKETMLPDWARREGGCVVVLVCASNIFIFPTLLGILLVFSCYVKNMS